MRGKSWLVGIAVTVLWGAGSAALGQIVPATHEPWLNWDFFNRTGQSANDFHIIVENPGYNPNPSDPNQVYTGPFQAFQAVTEDAYPSRPGDETRLSWSQPVGGTIPVGGVAHVGLSMAGSGRILDAYWTLNGTRIGPHYPIIYELTRVKPNTSNSFLGDISMILGTTDEADDQLDPAQQRWFMTNVRTWMDLNAATIGLQDLTTSLNLNTDPRLTSNETTPSPNQFPVDSFFDVFTEVSVGTTPNVGPSFESLLYGDVLLQNLDTNGNPTGPQVQYARFWNLNSQSPEPSSVILLLLAGAGMAPARRQRRAPMA